MPKRVLTADLIALAYELRGRGLSQQQIADKLGVAQTTISRVFLRQNWKHVPTPDDYHRGLA